jgi:hypothetical protein
VDKLGWIQVTDNLSIYSLTDDIIGLFNFIMDFIDKISPYYFGLIVLGFFVALITFLEIRTKFIKRLTAK